MHYTSPIREPLITGNKTLHDITEDISRSIEQPPRLWWIALLIAGSIATVGVLLILYTIWKGIGVWGLNKTVNWAWDITNFV